MLDPPFSLPLFVLSFCTLFSSVHTGDTACIFPDSLHRPFFFDVSSGAHPGTTIVDTVVEPADAQIQIASVRSNNVENTNFTSKFTLHQTTNGRFKVKNSDFLRLPTYPFTQKETYLYMTVICNDQAYPLITVRVKGEDNHAPQFYFTPYTMKVNEVVAVGTELDTPIIALDWDPSPEYAVQFRLENATDYFSLPESSTVRSSGFLPDSLLDNWNTEQLPAVVKLRVLKQLDYDKGPRVIYVNISARDMASPPNVNYTTVRVQLIDNDDLLPEFSSNGYVGVLDKNPTTGSLLHVSPPLHAFDGDRSINKSIVYSLDVNSLDVFTIDAESGEIMLIDEKMPVPRAVVVKATQSDNESRFSTTVVKIVSNIPPSQFSACSFSVSLPENAPPGTHVVHLNVQHRTEKTKVSILDPDGTFELDTETVTVRVKNNKILDREQFTTVELVVQMEDDTEPSDANTCRKARIHIELIDENDNSPMFEKEVYRYELNERTHDGDILGTFHATDKDEGENGRITYEIIDNGQQIPLELHEANGVLSLIYDKNRDNGEREQHVIIQAIDHGQHPRSKRVIVELVRKGKNTEGNNSIPPRNQLFREEPVETKRLPLGEDNGLSAEEDTTSRIVEDLIERVQRVRENESVEETQRKGRVLSRHEIEKVETSSASDSTTTVTPSTTVTRESSIRTTPTRQTSRSTMRTTRSVTTERVTTTERPRQLEEDEREEEEEEEVSSAERAFLEAHNFISGVRTARPHAQSVPIVTDEDKSFTVSPTLITEEKLTKLIAKKKSLSEEMRHSEEYEDYSTEEPMESEPFGFSDEKYEFDVFGPIGTGDIVGRVAAGPKAEMYGLDRKAVGLFKIDFDTGEITADSGLAEQPPGVFKLTASSTNGLHTAETSVAVNYDPKRSIFESVPRFDQVRYTIHVTEGQPPKIIATLKAFHRASLLQQSSLVYSLVTNENTIPFSIHESSGQLALLHELDREQRESYDFKVKSCLSSVPTQCGFAHVVVAVDDVNDNGPKFATGTYHVTIPNDLQKGSEVVQIMARDTDSGSNGEVSYVINPPSATFSIDHNTGTISTISPLTQSRYIVIVEAFDHGIPRRSAHAELRVTVEGSNPSAPEFDEPRYEVTLQAPVRAGSVVAEVHARDPDPGEDGRITYHFASTTDQQLLRDQRKFSINEHSGVVSATSPFSAFDGPFQLIVEAVDQSLVFRRKAQVMLTVNIAGHATLRFLPLPSTVYISSDKAPGSIVLRASAYTTGPSAVDFRLMEPSNEFAMDGDVLKVIAPLSHGETKLTIRAETDSTHVDHKLRIVVMSDRDKYPVFPHLAYDLEIPLESKFPILLHQFNPKLSNGTLRFSLFPPANVPIGLSINERTGELTVTRDYVESRSNQDTVFIVVRATNTKYPLFYSDVGVSLTLISTAASIRFPHSQYRSTVPENTPIGTLLNTTVQILPRLITPSLQYSLVPSSILGIHPNGTLFVRAKIDLEQLPVDQQGQLGFVVTARDGDQSGTARLQVTVVDVNEFVPTFDYLHYPAEISEAASPGTPIVKVRAFDKDFTEGEHLTYRITGGSGKDLVTVQKDGTVVLGRKSVDREQMAHFDVTIEALDNGGNSAETRVEVTVKDANDNAPQILHQPLIWNVTEGPDGVAETFDILASDVDEDSKISFRIVQGNEKGKFDLEQMSSVSATLRLLTPLDREENPIHKVTIEVRDQGTPPLMSLATVVVNVRNVNDKSPEFNRTEYRQTVPSDLPESFPILSVSAIDRDGDSLSYHLSGQKCDVLKVDGKGVVSFSSPIESRPTLPNTLNCILEASDGRHTTKTNIIVDVQNVVKPSPSPIVNHPPKFDQDTMVYNVDLLRNPSNTPRQVLGKIHSSDPEGDQLRLSIEPSEYRNLFEIDREGNLLVRNGVSSLNGQAAYSFLVVAEDGGKPPLSAFSNVRVNVIGGKTTVAPNPSGAPTITSTTHGQSVDGHTNGQTLGVTTPEVLSSHDGDSTVVSRHPSSLNTAGSRPITTVSTKTPLATFPTSQWATTRKNTVAVASTISQDHEVELSTQRSLRPLGQSTDRPDTTGKQSTLIVLPPGEPDMESTEWTTVDGGSESSRAPTIIPIDSEDEDEEQEVTTSQEVGTPFNTDSFRSTEVPSPAGGGAETVPTQKVTEHDPKTTKLPGEFSFSQPEYTAFMPEGRYSNGALLNVKPEPLSTNGKNVVYQIDDPNGIVPFYIKENTGEVVIFDVDRELAPSYSVRVLAIDRSSELNMHATALLTVTILDVNDNYPQFIDPPMTIGVARDTSPGTPLYTFDARDADADANGRVTYTVQENEWFTIDWKTGVLITRESLATAPDSFDLSITARDGGRPPLKTNHLVNIRMFHSSTIAPLLPRDKPQATVPVNTTHGTVIAHLLAGPTVGVKDKILYAIGDSEFGLFKMEDDGQLTLGREPKEEEMNRYHQLNVTAENSHGTDSIMFNVFVEGPSIVVTVPPTKGHGTNDICIFPKQMYNAEILENQEGRRHLTKVTSDCEEDGRKYRYVLWQGTDQFELDEKTGDIFVVGPLDREQRSIHFLFINVTKGEESKVVRRQANPVIEHAKSKLTAWQTLVVVRVKDENDNAPKFIRLTSEGKYTTTVDWQAPMLTPVVKLQAQDNDERNALTYGAYGGDSAYFTVNQTTGMIKLAKSIFEESKSEFHFTGTAADGVHVSEIPVSIYKLSPDHNIVQLTSEIPQTDIEEGLVERTLNEVTNTDMRVLVKQPFVNDKGQVEAKRTHVYVYALDTRSKVPIARDRLKELLDKYAAELRKTSVKISSVQLPATASTGLSLVDMILLVFCFILILVALVVCCLLAQYYKNRRRASSEKGYMVDARGAGPRPYDVEAIPRTTAQSVLSARPLPDPFENSANRPPTSDNQSHSTNRSDEQLIFANSVRDYGSRGGVVPVEKAFTDDNNVGVHTLVAASRKGNKIFDSDTMSSTLRAEKY